MKKLIGFASALALLVVPLPASADQWAAPQGNPETLAFFISDNFPDAGVSSILMSDRKTQNQYLCEQLGQGACSELGMDIIGNLVLPVCEKISQENCVESLEITLNGVTSKGSFVEYAPGPTVAQQTELGLPRGATIGKWQVPGMKHQGNGDDYAVYASIRPVAIKDGKVRLDSATIQVIPFNQNSGSFQQVAIAEKKFDDTGQSYVSFSGVDPNCAWTAERLCGRKQDFAEGSIVQVTVRLTSLIGGWFNGRMKSPDISISKHVLGSNRIAITGEPAKVSRLGFRVPKSEMTASLKDYFGEARSNVSGKIVLANQREAFEMVNASRQQVKDAASGETTTWAIQTVQAPRNSCLADTTKVLGIVTTNAMAYQSDAPSFTRGFLEYKVAGLHLNPDSQSPFLGTYDLVMRSEIARCLYGFSKAPISATVTVTGTGDQNIATTMVSEKDGWLKLAAYGFTFSEKQIKVKLSQPQSRTITKFLGTSRILTSKQKAEISSVIKRSAGNSKFICTGVYLNPRDKATATARARAACSYAKSLNKNFSFFSETKATKTSRFANKVMVVSK